MTAASRFLPPRRAVLSCLSCLAVAVWGSALVGCSEPGPAAERVGSVSSAVDAPLAEAFCTAVVTGVATVDTETDYLPHVINCEHGGAGIETLKAQAIAARSVLYHSMGEHGSICDGTNCQVYSCGRTPSAIHQQAVDETSGVYLNYNGNVTYGAYLAGDPDTAPPDCVGGPGESSAITYNEGKTGTDVEQTGLLWIWDPSEGGYGTNRGCMSQNGSSCLEDHLGYDYVEILQFYYGADIGMLQAPGPCILPLPGEGGAGGSGWGGGSVGGAAVAGGPAGGTGGAGANAGAAGGGVRTVPYEDDEGCACRAAGSGRGPSPWPAALLPLLLAGLGCRRRRAE